MTDCSNYDTNFSITEKEVRKIIEKANLINAHGQGHGELIIKIVDRRVAQIDILLKDKIEVEVVKA